MDRKSGNNNSDNSKQLQDYQKLMYKRTQEQQNKVISGQKEAIEGRIQNDNQSTKVIDSAASTDLPLEEQQISVSSPKSSEGLALSAPQQLLEQGNNQQYNMSERKKGKEKRKLDDDCAGDVTAPSEDVIKKNQNIRNFDIERT